jgi:hypothetical protein
VKQGQEDLGPRLAWAKWETLSETQTKRKRTGEMAQVEKCKPKALSSVPRTARKRKIKRKKSVSIINKSIWVVNNKAPDGVECSAFAQSVNMQIIKI